jgi:predicted nuclease with TOPRIM domain
MQFMNAELTSFLKEKLAKQEQAHAAREQAINGQVRTMKVTIESLTNQNNQLTSEVSVLKTRLQELDGGVSLVFFSNSSIFFRPSANLFQKSGF